MQRLRAESERINQQILETTLRLSEANARQTPRPPPPTTRTCPACGSTNITSTRAAESVSVSLGPKVFYEAHTDTCNMCEEQGDFNALNSSLIEAALLESGVRFVQETLREFESVMPLVSIDRCLGLKMRTAQKWRDGEMITRETVVLLQILKTFPWMLDVADEGYSAEVANTALREYLRDQLLID